MTGLFDFDPDTIPRGPFERLQWRLDALSKGIYYADTKLKFERMKERESSGGMIISITIEPEKHFPVRAHGKRVPR